LVAVQPLSPAFFFTSSLAFSAALPALSLVAVQPLSPAFFSTSFSTALPALSLSAVHPLDDAQPERLKPPALIKLAIPIPARSFFKSLLSILFLLCMKKWGRANRMSLYSLIISKTLGRSQESDMFIDLLLKF
jgi:hypothetical protein